MNDSWILSESTMDTAVGFSMCEYSEFSNAVYAFGGTNGFDIDTIQKYDVSSQQWSTLSTTMNIARADGDSIIYDNYIYIIGGIDEDQKLNSIEVFDVVSESVLSMDEVESYGIQYPVDDEYESVVLGLIMLYTVLEVQWRIGVFANYANGQTACQLIFCSGFVTYCALICALYLTEIR